MTKIPRDFPVIQVGRFLLPLYAKYITKLLRLFCSAVIYPWTCPYHLCLCRLDAKTLANVCWPVAISTLTKRVSLWPCTRDQSRYYCKSTKISFVSNWSDCPISNQLESPFSLLQRVRERARSAQELQWSVKNHSQKITLCCRVKTQMVLSDLLYLQDFCIFPYVYNFRIIWEKKTLIEILWLFLASGNDFYWLIWFLVVCMK